MPAATRARRGGRRAKLGSRRAESERDPELNTDEVELGEAALREKLGLRIVRLRHEGSKARIEVDPADIPRLQRPDQKDAILAIVKQLGFAELEIDPRGYRRADPLPPPVQED